MRIIQPGRKSRCVRHHEAHRPHEMRRGAQQHLALGERLRDEPELELLEVAQAAVDELAAGGARRAAEIALLGEHDAQARARRRRARCPRR